MTIKQLKEIIKNMPDDARVFARDRDCIALSKVHVVSSNPGSITAAMEVKVVASMTEVYGGDKNCYKDVKDAIIFCDCD